MVEGGCRGHKLLLPDFAVSDIEYLNSRAEPRPGLAVMAPARCDDDEGMTDTRRQRRYYDSI